MTYKDNSNPCLPFITIVKTQQDRVCEVCWKMLYHQDANPANRLNGETKDLLLL